MKLNRFAIIQLIFVATLVTTAYHFGRIQSMIEEHYAMGAPQQKNVPTKVGVGCRVRICKFTRQLPQSRRSQHPPLALHRVVQPLEMQMKEA